MAYNNWFGFRNSDDAAGEPSRGKATLSLQFTPHAATQNQSSHAQTQRGRNNMLNQTMYCKLARRPAYLTVTRGPRTELWRVNDPSRYTQTGADATLNPPRDPSSPALLDLVATVLWAPDSSAPTSTPLKTYPAVERAGVVAHVDEVLAHGHGGLFGQSSGGVKHFTSGVPGVGVVRWKQYTYGFGQRRFAAVTAVDHPSHGRPGSGGSRSRPGSGSGAPAAATAPSIALAELFPPEPGVLKPSFTVFSAAKPTHVAISLGSSSTRTPSSSTSSQTAAAPSAAPVITLQSSPATEQQTLHDELVLTALLLVCTRDDWRTSQSPTLEEIVRAELSSYAPTQSMVTLPAYGSSTSLPSYKSSE